MISGRARALTTDRLVRDRRLPVHYCFGHPDTLDCLD